MGVAWLKEHVCARVARLKEHVCACVEMCHSCVSTMVDVALVW